MRLHWKRRTSESNHDFDLVLLNPEDLNPARMHELLTNITGVKHRVGFSRFAVEEFRRFFDHPASPLMSQAYVRLSNWFLNTGGDRTSLLARHCEALWDELFAVRPLERLSSSIPGLNHIAQISRFQSFWSRLSKAQDAEGVFPDQDGEAPPAVDISSPVTDEQPTVASIPVSPDASELGGNSMPDGRVSLTFVKDGMHFQVEGSPNAMADFLHSLNKSKDN